MKNTLKNLITLWVCLFLGVPLPLFSQDMDVPMEVQYPLFLKILSMDRNLLEGNKDQLTIGIVYQEKFKTSYKASKDFFDAVENSKLKKINEIELNFVRINIENENLEKMIKKHGINVIYVTPIRAEDIESISKTSNKLKVKTLTGVQDYVESGLAVGIGLKGQKPEIVINLIAAKAEGADFSSKLLKLARVIQ